MTKSKNASIRLVSLALVFVMAIINFPPLYVHAEQSGAYIDASGYIVFPDANFKTALLDAGVGSGGEITPAQAATVTELGMWGFGQNNISSLDGIEYFTALRYLNCSNNLLTTLDVSQNTDLRQLLCRNNELTALDVSNNTFLFFFSCGGNPLTTLDVSNNTDLKYLLCNANQLTSLDLSQNILLEELYCGSNQLTSLDISKNTFIWRLECSNNQLTELDVSNNKKLGYLDCRYNNMPTEASIIGLVEIPPYYYFDPQNNGDPTLVITTAALPAATLNQSYSTTLTANGAAPITWSITSGSLPPGLNLTSSGAIAGTPTAVGTYDFTVEAANSIGSDTKIFSIIVNPNNTGENTSGGSSTGSSGGSSSSRSNLSSNTTVDPLANLLTRIKTAVENAVKAAAARQPVNASVQVKNANKITLAILKQAADTAKKAGGSITLHFDTISADEKTVIFRISVKPELAASDITLTMNEAKANNVKLFFEKHFANKVAVLSFDQQGSFGMTVEIAAKINLAGMDSKNLCFYSYDKKTNTYKPITAPNYWIDQNGYLHFATGLAGDIIISDGMLAKE